MNCWPVSAFVSFPVKKDKPENGSESGLQNKLISRGNTDRHTHVCQSQQLACCTDVPMYCFCLHPSTKSHFVRRVIVSPPRTICTAWKFNRKFAYPIYRYSPTDTPSIHSSTHLYCRLLLAIRRHECPRHEPQNFWNKVSYNYSKRYPENYNYN